MAWKLFDTLEPGFDGALLDNGVVKGGIFVVKTLEQRNTKINQLQRNLDGGTATLCFVSSKGTVYELINNPATDNTSDSDWKKLDFGVSDVLVAKGNWNADNTSPEIFDVDAVGNGNDFYVVEGAPTPTNVQIVGLFGGEQVEVVDGDWIISNGTEWFKADSPLDWDSIPNIPTVINDYVLGTVISHNHAISEVTGLQDALDLKYDLSSVGDHNSVFSSLSDEKLIDVFLVKANFYQKSETYTQSEVDALVGGVNVLTTKGDILGHNGTIPTRIPIGADGLVLMADAAEASGFKWAANAPTAGSGTGVDGTAVNLGGALSIPTVITGTVTNSLSFAGYPLRYASDLSTAGEAIGARWIPDLGYLDANFIRAGADVDWNGSIVAADSNTIQNTVTADISAQATAGVTFDGIDWDITEAGRTADGNANFINFKKNTSTVFRTDIDGNVFMSGNITDIAGNDAFIKAGGTTNTTGNTTIIADNTNALSLLDRTGNVGLAIVSNATLDGGVGLLSQEGSFTFDENNTLGVGAGIILEDIRGGVNAHGIEYAADYSAGFTARSLIDKGYADGAYLLNGATTTLTATTTIAAATNTVDFTSGGTGNFLVGALPFAATDTFNDISLYSWNSFRLATGLIFTDNAEIFGSADSISIDVNSTTNGLGIYMDGSNLANTFRAELESTAGELYLSGNGALPTGMRFGTSGYNFSWGTAMVLESNTITLGITDASTPTTGSIFRMQLSGGATYTDYTDSPINYAGDYSTNYTTRSLIDKGYADGAYITLDGTTQSITSNKEISLGTNVLTITTTDGGNDPTLYYRTDYQVGLSDSSFGIYADNSTIPADPTAGSVFGAGRLALYYKSILSNGTNEFRVSAGAGGSYLKLTGDSSAFTISGKRGNNGTQFKLGNDSSTDKSWIWLIGGNVDDSEYAGLVFDLDNEGGLAGGGVIFTDARATTVGMQYEADYSSGFTARSLIDKGYADGAYLLNGAATTISADTTITQSDFSFTLDSTDTASAKNEILIQHYRTAEDITKRFALDFEIIEIGLYENTNTKNSSLLFSGDVDTVGFELRYQSGANKIALEAGDTSPTGLTLTDSVNSVGLRYAADYSTAGAAIGVRWIPDKGYNDGAYISKVADSTLTDGVDFTLGTTTGTKFGTATTQKIGFFNATPVVQQTALTANVGTLTFVDENTPDYAMSSLTTTSAAGFSTLDEAQGFVELVATMQTRIDELETKLQALGLLA